MRSCAFGYTPFSHVHVNVNVHSILHFWIHAYFCTPSYQYGELNICMALHKDEVFTTLWCREGSHLEAGDINVMFCGLCVLYITTCTTIPSVLYTSLYSTPFGSVPFYVLYPWLCCTSLCTLPLNILTLWTVPFPEQYLGFYTSNPWATWIFTRLVWNIMSF